MRLLQPSLSVLLLLSGCPNDVSEDPALPSLDMAQAETPCVKNPQTHVEILNACTSAQSVDKKTLLPLLRSDGTLPPLP